IAQIQTDLNQLAQHLNLSRAVPSDVGGQPTYTVRMSPKQAGGLVGQVQLAWDAIKGVPLRFAVYARGDGKPVLQLEATNVSYGPVTGVFNLTPPAGYRVVNVAMPSSAGASSEAGSKANKHGTHAQISGVQAVAKHLSFKLVAPTTVGGLQRSSVSLLGHTSHAGALVIYGQGLGGIAVMEQPATASSSQQLQLSSQQGDHQRGLSLPSFSVHGATAQELDTALGTFVRFTANGVTYTIIGSVKPHTARAAARGL
ncbi:MAG: hypothetical protein JO244_01640, partial [Solirubrobacterales bacterium]|nr:hypothetical protein [Solirubrobacterales bacterium]